MRGISSIVVLFVVLAMFVGAVQLGFGSEISNSREVLNRLQSDFPGVMVSQEEGRITRLYGKPMGFGSSPINTAEQFKINYGQAFGVNGEDLKAESFLLDGRQTQPVMYDRETGEYKFTLVYYSQHQDNIPVFRADLRLLVLNQSGYPLVLASSALRDLGDFSVSNTAINYSLAENAARMFSNDLRVVNQPRLVVWAGINDMEVQPSTAMEIIADNGMPATGDYEKWLLLVDVNSGEVIYSQNMIIDIDIEGNVSGMATLGGGAEHCEEEDVLGMPYVGVYIEGENPVYADENGDFIIPFAGGDMVNVISELEGQWFRVQNQGGSNARIPRTVIPPGPVNFIHNEENTEEFERAEVNGYYHANVVRDFTLTYNPDYPGLQQAQFPVNVNLNDNCNAYYDYSSINFFSAGGGCANTAFSTVIHHEYGHHLVAMAGSGQGQYGEGMGDVMGVLIMDDPGLAYGFFGDCFETMRSADNNLQYPCSGEIHYCGQLISGCVWDTRIALEVTYPDTYIDIISNLAVNAMLLHTGDMITPDVTIDYLTLDDDNGDIYDGTPHYPEICEGFNAHSMECPQLRLIEFIYPDGHPDLINPEGTTIRVEVQGFLQEPVPGTGMLYYSTGDEWTSVAMVEVSNNVYDAVFPVIECGYEVSFYFSADTDQGTTVYDPWNAPSASYAAFSAFGLETLFYDDFEYDEGWEVVNDCLDGQWDRGEPVGGGDRGDPPSDYDESGSCFLTDNQYGNSDVDDGYTYLISPTFDLTDKETMIQYALWYTNFAGDNPQSDVFITYISDDNGESWIEAEEIGPNSESGWHIHSFAVNNLITPNNQVRIRFEASDLGGGSVVEAGIDAFEIIEMDCGPTSVQPGVNENQIPLQYALRGCYPNPFNATTNISYELPATGQVTLEIFNVMGQKVTTLINGSVEAGRHNVSWDASSFTSGIYFYKLEAGDRTFTKRMTLLK